MEKAAHGLYRQVVFIWKLLFHARGSERCCTFSLSLINRLNKTESAIFTSLFWFGCSQGIDFLPEYLFYQGRDFEVWLLFTGWSLLGGGL